MQEWIWRDVRIEIPADWEMLQFSREREKGRCAFADRRQFRLELSWRQVKGAPDFPRMMSDYKSRLESRGELANAETFTLAGWHGLAGRQKNVDVSRLGNYFEADRLLVELVFLWPDKREIALEKDVAQSCRYILPQSGFRICKAFGMTCRIPEKYEFSACHVQPALSSMVFSGLRRPSQLKFQRLGMVPQWMKHPLADWLRAQVPADVKNLEIDATGKGCFSENGVAELRPPGQRIPSNLHDPHWRVKLCETVSEPVSAVNGHAKIEVRGDYRPKGLLLPKGLYRASAWICPKDGRLYHAENIYRPGEEKMVLDCRPGPRPGEYPPGEGTRPTTPKMPTLLLDCCGGMA